MAFVGEEGRTDEEVLNDLFWAVLNSGLSLTTN